MGDVHVDGEASGPGNRPRDMIRCSLRCTGRIMFWVEFGSGYDVRANVILSFRFTIRHG